MAPDLLSTIRREVDERLSELRPLLAEYERLLGAVEALDAPAGQGRSVSAPQPAATVKPARRRVGLGAARRGSAAGAIELAAADPAEPVPPVWAATETVVEDPVKKESEQLDVDAHAGMASSRSETRPKPDRAAPGVAREAILAALDHGSHTVGELAVVTAMSGPNITGNLRRLIAEGAIVKTEREGKAAWALPDTAD